MTLMSLNIHSCLSKVLIRNCGDERAADDTGWLAHSMCNENTNIDAVRNNILQDSGSRYKRWKSILGEKMMRLGSRAEIGQTFCSKQV